MVVKKVNWRSKWGKAGLVKGGRRGKVKCVRGRMRSSRASKKQSMGNKVKINQENEIREQGKGVIKKNVGRKRIRRRTRDRRESCEQPVRSSKAIEGKRGGAIQGEGEEGEEGEPEEEDGD